MNLGYIILSIVKVVTELSLRVFRLLVDLL